MAKSNSRLIADLLSGQANEEVQVKEQIVFEGATENGFETTFQVIDPTADRTITYPDDSGLIALAKNVASNAAFQAALANTNAYIATKFDSAGGTISGNLTLTGHLLPSANNTYDLGSTDTVWRDVYIGPGSLYINGSKVLEDDADTIVVKADSDQSLSVKTTGTGETTIQSEAGVNVTTGGSSDIQINAGGNIELKSTVQVLSTKRITDSAGVNVEFGDNIEMNSNKITGVGTPSNTGDATNKSYVDGLNTTVTNSVTTLSGTVGSNLANTNAYIASVQADVDANEATERAALANTNAYIASVQADVDANEATERAALANTNSYIASVSATERSALANTNAYIATKLDSSVISSYWPSANVITYVDSEVAALVDSAPATLDTLNELAAALGDDSNFASTLTTNLGQKLGATATVTLTGDVTASATAFSSNAVSLSTSLATSSGSTLANYITVANTSATYQTIAVERAALANTNAYIASVSAAEQQHLANTNARITTLELESGVEGGGFVLGTLTEFPGTDGDVDYLEGGDVDETYVGSTGQTGSDAFGVSLQAVYDNMDPIGRIITNDLGSL
jgi:hypothetical protein